MDFEDVNKVITVVEPEIKDIIDIIGLLPYLNFTKLTEKQIRAQATQQGEPYASSLFFRTISSKPNSFKTLLAALIKIGQREIAEKLLKQTRKHFKKTKREDTLKQVLDEINEERRKLGVEDSESGSDPDEPGDDRGNRPPRPGPSTPKLPEAGLPIKQTSPDSNTEQPFQEPRPSSDTTVLYRRDSEQPFQEPRPSSDTTVLYRRQPNEPSVGGRDSGLDRRLSSLKVGLHRKLAKELEKKNEGGEQNWVAIAESETVDLDIIDEEIQKIEKDKKPGTEFLRYLDSKGYTVQDLTLVFQRLNMQEAIAIIRPNENEVAMPGDQRKDNNLNMAGSSDNREENYKSLNIKSGKEEPEKQFYSLPSAPNENTKSNSGGELQPIQVSSSRSSLTDNSSYSSSPCGSNANLSDSSNLKDQQAVQSVGDPVRESSVPNPSMEALKLREDVTNPVLNVSQDSFKDIQKSPPKGQGDVGIELTAGQDSQTTDNTRDLSGAQVPDESMSSYYDSSTSVSTQFMNIPPTVGQDAGSIQFSSYSTDDSLVESITDVSLKGTQPIQPVTERDQVVPDQQREAEELRHDRIHGLDEHPSALGSFADVKAKNDVQEHTDDVAMAAEGQAVSHEFRETMTEPQLLEEENGAATGAAGGPGEGGNSNMDGRVEDADDKVNNIPDLSVFRSNTEDNSNLG